MKIEIVSIGTELLVSDILDTNSAYISRCLREVDVSITTKVTVGDDVEMIADVLTIALGRADAVLTTGGLGNSENDFTRDAISLVTGDKAIKPDDNPENKPSNYKILGDEKQYGRGLLIETEKGALISLPGNRKELAYLLEAEVLPFLRQRATAVSKVSDWVLLRTVGVMESTVKEELADIAMGQTHRITYDSFAGQTNIRIWVENVTPELVQNELLKIKATVTERLGDHIFGSEEDLLEQVVLTLLARHNKRLAVAECFTHATISNAFTQLPQFAEYVTTMPVERWETVVDELGIDPLDNDHMVQWCRAAATATRTKYDTDVSLFVFNHVQQGGIQIIVVLAAPSGVSVTQRSFGGHPENIYQWSLTLGLSHLRRWLMSQQA